jgi:hypothetical protein
MVGTVGSLTSDGLRRYLVAEFQGDTSGVWIEKVEVRVRAAERGENLLEQELSELADVLAGEPSLMKEVQHDLAEVIRDVKNAGLVEDAGADVLRDLRESSEAGEFRLEQPLSREAASDLLARGLDAIRSARAAKR